MRISSKWLLAVFSLHLLAAACSDPLSGQQKDLVTNRELWEAEAISDYSYRLQVLCFCPPEITDPVIVEVSQDSIIAVVDAASGEPVDSARFRNYYTVAGLFDVIENAIDREAHELVVTYDAVLHYPTRIIIDPIEQAVDEELSLLASDLLPGG